jgi:hypothetical protein
LYAALCAWLLVGCGADAIEADLRDTTDAATQSDADDASTSGAITDTSGGTSGATDTTPDAEEVTAPRCGDGAANGQEACDGADLGGATCASLGLGSGDLRCQTDCKFDLSGCQSAGPVCGDGARQPPEVCDGPDLGGLTACASLGLGAGALSCTAACTINTSGCEGAGPTCGDGLAEGPEACDGTDFKGKTCQTEGFISGILLCDGACAAISTAQCTRCGNGAIDGGEACDGLNLNAKTCQTEGFDDGALTCSATCALDTSACTRNSCGNGALDPGEDCEGANLNGRTCQTIPGMSFNGGTLTCTSNCAFNTSACTRCGDNVAQGAEACDGPDLRSRTCVAEGFDGGALTCSATCTLNTSACTRIPAPIGGQVVITEIMHSPTILTTGDWFEVHNVTTETFNLQGCTIATDDARLSYTIPTRLLIQPGAYATFAHPNLTAFTPTHTIPGLALAADDVITLRCGAPAVVVDEVLYISGTGYFPSLVGRSLSLRPNQTSAAANDDPANWCLSVAEYAAPDRGSPGVDNPICPTGTVGFCRLQYPGSIGPGGDVTALPATIYGRVYVQGLTDQSPQNNLSPLLVAQAGYGPFGSDPRTQNTWAWVQALPNPDYPNVSPEANNDEYQATFQPSIPRGDYSFTVRFSYDGGTTWLTCDRDGVTSGPSLPFDINQLGTLEVP